jgi:hypothetical protein
MNDDVGIGNQCVDGAAVQNVALPIRRLQPPHRCRVKRPARHAVNTLDCGVAAYVVMVAVLLVRPQGLLGTRDISRV